MLTLVGEIHPKILLGLNLPISVLEIIMKFAADIEGSKMYVCKKCTKLGK